MGTADEMYGVSEDKIHFCYNKHWIKSYNVFPLYSLVHCSYCNDLVPSPHSRYHLLSSHAVQVTLLVLQVMMAVVEDWEQRYL